MIDLTAKIDNEEAVKELRELQKVAKQTTSSVVTDADRMDMAMARIARTLGQIGAGASLVGLVKQVGDVRSEFQKLEISFETMLQSEAKAASLMAQLTQTAAATPFGLQEVAGGAKQLLAYGTAAEKVNDTLIRLGDIASGLSIPLGDLVYLYGTTQTQGRLFTQDLRQFQGRGIPLAEELAKQFGVTSAEVGELVTAGKVGFAEVEKAIISMTSEGGKFGGLMAEQSKTIGGLKSNLEDAFDMMFNDIGKKTEGAFTGVLKVSIELVENYEKVIDLLVPLVATYGSYKAALIVVAAAQKAHNVVLAEAAIQQTLCAAAGHKLSQAQAMSLARTMLLQKGWKALTASIKASSVAMLASPVTWITAALAGLSYVIYRVVTAETAQEKAQRKANEALEQYGTKQEELKSKAEELHSIMKDEATTAYQQEKAYQQLIAAYPELLDKYDKEKILLMDIVALRKELAGITDTRDRAFIEAERQKALEDYNFYSEEVTTVTGDVRGPVVTTKQRNSKKAAEAFAYYNQLSDQLREMNRIQEASLPVADKIAAKQKELNRLKEDEKRIDKEITDAQIQAMNEAAQGEIGIYGQGKEDFLQAQKQANINRQKALELEIKSMQEVEVKKKNLTEKELKQIEKNRKRASDLSVQLVNDARQAEVDAMAEGTNKILAQIKLDYDLREAEIKKREAELRALQGGKLTEEQDVAIRSARRSSGKKYEQDIYSKLFAEDFDADKLAITAGGKQFDKERAAWNEHLIEYGSYRESLQAIKDKYDQLMAKAKTKGEKADLKAQMTEDLAKMESIAGTAEAQLMDALAGLEQMLADAEALYAEIADKNSPEAKAEMDYISELRKQFWKGREQLEKKRSARSGKGKDKKPDEEAVKEWKELQRTLSSVDREFEQLGKDIGGTAGAVISATGSIAANTVSAISGIVQFGTSSMNAIQNAATATQKAIAIAEASTVLLAVLSAVMQIGQKIASLFGADYDQYNAMKARYENLSEVWDKLIDKKREYIEMSYGAEAAKATDEAIEITKQQEEAARQLGKERLNAGASAGSHSIGVRQRKRMNAEDKAAVQAVADEMGFDAASVLEGRMKGLFELSAEQLEQLMTNAPTFWAKLDDDVKEYLETIIESNEQIKELEELERERLTQISWDEMYSSFVDTLMDMESSAQDFSKDFSEMMMRAMLATQLSKGFEEKLEKWYQDFAAANEDGFISESERQALQDQYNTYVDEAIDMRDKLAEVVGYGSADAQSATARGFQAMDQETGSELNGRFTDLQMKAAQQLGISDSVQKQIEVIKNLSLEQYKMSIDTRDILINLSGNVSQIRGFAESLPSIQTAVERTNRILDERL